MAPRKRPSPGGKVVPIASKALEREANALHALAAKLNRDWYAQGQAHQSVIASALHLSLGYPTRLEYMERELPNLDPVGLEWYAAVARSYTLEQALRYGTGTLASLLQLYQYRLMDFPVGDRAQITIRGRLLDDSPVRCPFSEVGATWMGEVARSELRKRCEADGLAVPWNLTEWEFCWVGDLPDELLYPQDVPAPTLKADDAEV